MNSTGNNVEDGRIQQGESPAENKKEDDSGYEGKTSSVQKNWKDRSGQKGVRNTAEKNKEGNDDQERQRSSAEKSADDEDVSLEEHVKNLVANWNEITSR